MRNGLLKCFRGSPAAGMLNYANIDMNRVFGSLREWKKPTEKILKEADEELWHE